MIIWDRLFCRLGNNITQLSNIIDIAIAYKHNIKINNIKLQFFDLSIIEEYFSKYDNKEIIRDNKRYFFNKYILPFPERIFKENSEERNKLLQKAFLIKNIKKLDENDIVIHIRSGDIFSSNPFHRYTPPPLCYYIKELNKRKYETIHIVCEDNINPVVNELLKLYKNAVHQINSLEDDIRIILGATNVVCSVGSFIPALMLLSTNVKYRCGKWNDNEEFKEYYKIMRPWKNTQVQRDYILTYQY